MMTKQATLGPIDPSVNGPLNPQAPGPNPMARIPISVESINGYFEMAKSLGIKDEKVVDHIMLNLADKIHPVVLGNVYRSRSQIRMLGTRLLSTNIKDGKKIDKILDFLCSDSGSHDYPIYRREARDELGLTVNKPNDDQYKVLKKLHDDYTQELELLVPFDPNVVLGIAPEKEYNIKRGLLESVQAGSIKFISQGKLARTRVQVGPLPTQVQEGIQDQRKFEGWKND